MVTNKDICAFYYEVVSEGQYKCKLCGVFRKQLPRSGYSNLTGHLSCKHPDFQTTKTFHQSHGARPLIELGFIADKTRQLLFWMRLIVQRDFPISEVENELTRSMSKWKPVTARALWKAMEGVAIKIGVKLEGEMGTSFGLIFDDWSHGSLHYVGIFAVYCVDGELKLPLLGLSTLEDGSQSADAHIKLILAVLSVYNKTGDMVRFLVGDNCVTNKAIATKMDVLLVGCASHRFNLGVEKFLPPYKPVLETVNSLMVQLRQPNNSAELAKLTKLRPVKRNLTRWSSTFEMLGRYIRIRGEIKQVEAVEDMIPTGSDHKEITSLHSHLKKLDSLCKRLQRTDLDMAQVRVLFDSVVSEFPTMSDYLSPGASIVHDAVFKAVVMKVINGENLSAAEKKALKQFEVTQGAAKKRKQREEYYADKLLRAGAQQYKRGRYAVRYDDMVAKILPTSNVVERLSSRCKLVMSPQRSSMTPANFEMLAFPKANGNLWDVMTVASLEEEVE